jgi:F-box/TPR repeat protein Pof3
MDLNSKERLPKEAEDLLLQCSTAREEKNYGEAIYFVNAALECSQKAATAPHLLVGVHDIRHAVCGRAGNLDEALKSAKAMIRLDRSDARGYLRCGRLERDRGNKTAALRYYEHGVKNCPNSIFLNILRELADDMRDELSAELVLSRARDPMTSLPLEIMDMVLSHLNYRQVVRMLRVSKSWRRLLSDRPPLSDTIAFPSDTAVPITPYMALVTLDRLKTTPRVLKLASLTPAARIMLQNRFVATPILESLKIFMLSDRGFDTHNLSFSSVNLRKLALPHPTRCRRAVVDRILLQCSSLEVASFSVEENIFDEPDWSFSSDSLIELDVGCDDDRTSLVSDPSSD